MRNEFSLCCHRVAISVFYVKSFVVMLEGYKFINCDIFDASELFILTIAKITF